MRKLRFFATVLITLAMLLSASVAITTEPIPTAEQVKGWEAATVLSYPCGPFVFLTNPDLSSKHPAGYIHLCKLHRGKLSQYGFWEEGELREFGIVGSQKDGTWKEIFRSYPALDEAIRDLIPRII